MSHADAITLFHAPQTRSSGVLTLLEELGAPYELHALNMKAGEHLEPAYRAINPMAKVPAILHRGALVTEQVAIYIYLADLFPQADLTPALDDARRGPYLRWLVFYAACYEPALVDRSMQREPGPRAMCPYGDFDTMLGALTTQLSAHPYLLGEAPTAADVLWGNALRWGMMFKVVPETPLLTTYVERMTSRPAVRRAGEIDAELIAAREAASAG